MLGLVSSVCLNIKLCYLGLDHALIICMSLLNTTKSYKQDLLQLTKVDLPGLTTCCSVHGVGPRTAVELSLTPLSGPVGARQIHGPRNKLSVRQE